MDEIYGPDLRCSRLLLRPMTYAGRCAILDPSDRTLPGNDLARSRSCDHAQPFSLGFLAPEFALCVSDEESHSNRGQPLHGPAPAGSPSRVS